LAIENLLGNVVSNSFGISGIVLADLFPSELVVENGISEIAAVLGIAMTFPATMTAIFWLLIRQTSALTRSLSKRNQVTSVGATSTFLNNNTIKFQTGWGLNFTCVAEPTPKSSTRPASSIWLPKRQRGRDQRILRQTSLSAWFAGYVSKGT